MHSNPELSEAARRRSIFFLLRSVLCFVILGLLVLRSHPIPFLLWVLGTAYLVSNILILISPQAWFASPSIAYGLFLLDVAGLSVILYAVTDIGSESLLLFYLTIFLATIGQNLRQSIAIAFATSAIYVALRVSSGGNLLKDSFGLIHIPLFLVTAVLCGYLAQEVRRHKREVRSLKEIQESLERDVGTFAAALGQSEDLRVSAQELAQRFRNLVQDLNAVVWEMEVPSFRVSFVSNRAEDVLGHPAENWLREADFWQNHIHPEDRRHIVELSQKSIGEGKDYSIEYRALAADGRVVWLHDIVRLVRDSSGRVRQLRGVTVDITARKQLEEEFLQAQKMEAVGRLAGGVAHDFNNLLTIISGYVELVLEKLDAVSPLKPHVEEIKQASDRAAGLTRRLLAFSRRQAIMPQVLNLGEVAAGTQKMLRRLIGEDIELVLQSDPLLGSVRADPAQIEQVLVNLAVNARDAMPQGGKIVIETSNVTLDEGFAGSHAAVTPGPYVMLAMSDSGTGMEASVRAHIFEPFFTTKERGKGTGLGLATVYGIVKQSDGNIWVYSQPGVGTTFKIYLPRVDIVPESRPQAAPPSPRIRRSETILLVEDEDAVRSLVRGLLEREGYQVLEASRPSEALALNEQHEGPIHLILSDVVMPQMNGPQLAEKLVSMRPDTRVVYMSGYTDNAIVHYDILDQGTPFLQKPFSHETLAHKVREALDGPAPRQGVASH
jgi:two-component system cell cycle sensor histidine kinase/response regulator CckA